MRKVLLGGTGLEISELALGGGDTAGLLIDADEPTRHDALKAALAAGVNWIDTAPAYGNGESERTIGRHRAALAPPPHLSACLEVIDSGRFNIAQVHYNAINGSS
jgi:aryl-alcohol dehydrogenase-like predicted oxidoreductase